MERKRAIALVVLVVAALLTLTIALVVSSLQILNSNEIGLQYDRIQKHLLETPFEEGLHLGPVGYEFLIFPSVYKTINFDKLYCLNKDGVPIELIISLQYRARKSALYRIATEFKNHESYLETLTVIAESAIHEACSKFRTSQFPTQRGNFTREIRQRLTNRFDEMDCEVTDVQVNNFERPEVYEEAVRAKERAREDIQAAQNERPRQLTEANRAKREAEFHANITLAKAYSQATILENQARAETKAILIQYEKEADTYAEIIGASGLNFTAEGFLSYLGVRVIADARNPVYVGIRSPAKSSYIVNP
ncbi:uncharacterized protein LOC135464521 [Liolophura sinensis]|uniref:uncharacterized protein LOC135464521 n=1 Tax=Liolophura sinensis TaxID=3198878 RepID=UPI003158BC6F